MDCSQQSKYQLKLMWRNGIRSSLRNWCPNGLAGSSPVISIMKLDELIKELEYLEAEFGGDVDVVVYPDYSVGTQKFVSNVNPSTLDGRVKIVISLHKEVWPT